MKISASIYSDKKRPLKEVIEDLVQHQVDLLHVDCNDDLTVFDDIQQIRQWCNLPIDLHIITEEPDKYFDLLKSNRDTIRKEVCWSISNITAGTKSQIQVNN